MTDQVPEPTVPEVVANDDAPTLAQPAKAPAPRTGPKWETEVRERVKATIKKFSKPLNDLVARDANEGDTRLLVTDFLCYGLGYDKYQDLTTEYQVKGDFADYGVRIDKDLIAFIEVKRCATRLTTKHLRQVEMYAVNEGVEWLILTNGVVWQVYHVTGGLPVIVDLAFDVNLFGDETVAQKANLLFYISKEALKRRQIDDLWKAKRATAPKSLANVVLSSAVTESIRKELRRTTGQNVEGAEISRLMKETVLRPECFA
jgi:predicted type IV restriction endonuclease